MHSTCARNTTAMSTNTLASNKQQEQRAGKKRKGTEFQTYNKLQTTARHSTAWNIHTYVVEAHAHT